MALHFETVEEVDEQKVEDLIVTFLGQSMGEYSWWGYWDAPNLPPHYNSEEVGHAVVHDGASIRIMHDDGETEEEGTSPKTAIVNMKDLHAAIRQVAAKRKMSVNDLLDNHDIGDADSVFQVAVHGKEVFG
jgi:hypothetical protein